MITCNEPLCQYKIYRLLTFSQQIKSLKAFIDNSGNHSTNSPEFSNGQFGKTNDTINRIVHRQTSYS